MWGGVKKRTHYGDLFKNWSATRGLEELRTALYKEPRPWYLAFALHQHNHLLQDHHCARLLAWSTSVVELRPSLAAKREAYQYTQEMFRLFMHHHKVGSQTFNEYMRLCAVGSDLTSAFDWFKYWQEAQLGDYNALPTLTWLLYVAHTTPSDERAEDMALTVMDLYVQRFTGPPGSKNHAEERGKETDDSGARPTWSSSSFTHFEPNSPADAEALRRFFSAFKSLAPRLEQNAALRHFLDTIPLSDAEAAADCAAFGWPVESPHHVFPQLEQRLHVLDYAQANISCYAYGAPPCLRDSLLHPTFVAKLEHNAAEHNVSGVVALVEEYERRVKEEKQKTGGERSPALRRRTGEGELWGRYSDASAVAYRRRLIEEGGVTAELYHYLVVALATTQPTAALRTLDDMVAANLQPLDLTRAAVLVAVRDSPDDQRRLFKQQLDEMDARARWDADHDTFKVVEAYWKYNYGEFFHHRNSLSRTEFYLYLLARLGPKHVQQLLLDTQTHGLLATAEDLVVLDENLRHASRLFYRARVGRGPVQAALDAISHHMPKLDISLVGSMPHFENYYVEAADGIAHSEDAIAALLRPYDTLYVLDTSFIETSESFLGIGAVTTPPTREQSGAGASQSLVLIPYLTLAQLASSVASSAVFTSFDPALQQAIRSEPFLASQRLRALFAMISSSSTAEAPHTGASTAPSPNRRARVLHFTECLCANQVDAAVLDKLHLSPATSDNDQLLLVLAMLSCLKPQATQLVLCTDDVQLVERLELLQNSDLFGSAVGVVSTAPPANLDVEKNLVDDNPVWRDDSWNAATPEFEPRLEVAVDTPASHQPPARSEPGVPSVPHVAPNQQPHEESVEPTHGAVSSASPETLDSPWLALLAEAAEETSNDITDVAAPSAAPARTSNVVVADTEASATAADAVPSSSSLFAPTEAEHELREKVMNLYETPYDVVPVGVRMQNASALGSLFAEFDSIDPELREAQAADRAAASSRLSQGGDDGNAGGASRRRHRRSVLEKEMLANRGYSNKERFRMARQLSNQSGGRVPFNMRYRVVEANVRDPRNAHLRKVYQESLEKKRAAFKRHHG
jgi:hypothetical protein